MVEKSHNNPRNLRNSRVLSTLEIVKGKSVKSICLEKAESEQIDDIDQDTVLERMAQQNLKLSNFIYNCSFYDKPGLDKNLHLR